MKRKRKHHQFLGAKEKNLNTGVRLSNGVPLWCSTEKFYNC